MAHLRTVKFPWRKGQFIDEVDVIYFGEIGCGTLTEGDTIFVDFFNANDGRIWAKLGITAGEARVLATNLLSAANAIDENGC